MELDDLQILAQLIDILDITAQKLEKAYGANDAEKFRAAEIGIIETNKKIDGILK